MDANSTAVIIALFKKFQEKIERELNKVRTQKGDKGDPGLKGERGPKGDKGIKGDRGPQGERGETGLKGEQGPIGLKGDKGDRGETGEKGDKGEKGDQGEQGSVGPKGDRGETGSPGKDGARGDKGDTGPQGAVGPRGERGEQGPEGPQGPKGDTGDQGPRGEKGDKGDRGEQGDRGPKGEKGDRGDQGPVGPQGERGEKGDPGEVPDVTPIIEKAQKDFNKWRESVNRNLASIGGGGSTKILQMDDVVYKKRSLVEGDSILIFDPVKSKFEVTNLSQVLQRIKVDVEKQYNKLIDTEGSYIYIGEADPGSSPSDAVWRIKRIEEVGDDYNILWAEGTDTFVQTWDDRLSYTYN